MLLTFAVVILAFLSSVQSSAIPQRNFRAHTECTYATTEKHALYGFNDIKTLYQSNLEQCIEECTSNQRCLSFDYNRNTDSCFLSSETKQTQPQAFGKHSKVTYYEKECKEVETETTRPPTLPELTTPQKITTTYRPFTITDEESSGLESGSGTDQGESGSGSDHESGDGQSTAHTECTYATTEKHVLYGFNDIKTMYQSNLEQCIEECTSNQRCLSFDYNRKTDCCFLSSETKQTQPQAFRKHSKVTYYEKECKEVETETTRPPTLPELTTPQKITTTYRPFTITDEESSGLESGSGTDQGESGSGSDHESGDGQSTDCFKVYTPPGGSNGGSPFSDESHVRHGRISGLQVYHGFLVYCIGFNYGSYVGDCHGTMDEEVSAYMFANDEYVTAIEGRMGDQLDKITFITNKSSYGPFGKSSGGSSFEVDHDGRELAYIKGRAGNLIDKLEFYFRC